MKAAPTPWRFEKAGEGMAHVFGANGQYVGTMHELDARMAVEGVNHRMDIEANVYRAPRREWATPPPLELGL